MLVLRNQSEIVRTRKEKWFQRLGNLIQLVNFDLLQSHPICRCCIRFRISGPSSSSSFPSSHSYFLCDLKKFLSDQSLVLVHYSSRYALLLPPPPSLPYFVLFCFSIPLPFPLSQLLLPYPLSSRAIQPIPSFPSLPSPFLYLVSLELHCNISLLRVLMLKTFFDTLINSNTSILYIKGKNQADSKDGSVDAGNVLPSDKYASRVAAAPFPSFPPSFFSLLPTDSYFLTTLLTNKFSITEFY